MFQVDLLTLLALFGTLQGFIIAALFWFRKGGFYNKLFALLILVTSIRIAKNVVVHVSELNPELFWSSSLVQTLIYIGLAHQFAIGPLFYFYFYVRVNAITNLKKLWLVHILPYVLLLLASPFLEWVFWSEIGLLLSYVSVLAYYLVSVSLYALSASSLTKSTSLWLRYILILSALLLVAYSPALFKYMGYIGGAVLYAIGIISAGYLILFRKNSIAIFNQKYITSPVSSTEANDIKERLEHTMNTQKLYLNQDVSLKSLAADMDVSSHKLSQVINTMYKKSYSEYINSFRLKEAVMQLENPLNKNLKIAAIAFDAGFNSQPTFNKVFKKQYKVTPSVYRSTFFENT